MATDKNILAESLTQSLNGNIESITSDFTEMTIDAFMDTGILKDIPFVSTVVAVYKIGHSLKELSFIKKLALFIQELNKGIVDDEKRQEYISQIKADTGKSQKVIEYLLLMLDRFVQLEKSQQLAKLCLSYFKLEINWLSFCQYSEVIERMFPGDIAYLDSVRLSDKDRDDMAQCALQRLQGIGLIAPTTKTGVYDKNGNAIATLDDGTYHLTAFGRVFYQIMSSDC